ncbi:predicted protein [Coccidioides posadasii str. Silveira]|uniref:Predicted protein n=2 Tax=Coccidioides posadasii TaxID=199306 RepID=E9D663_COCPS|nr:predicted protein [Coccidioides posadasii str. Silveira]KMM66210.1 hypothetical protein CPAG_02550 [Coccidioides posadasii RMSCC 3488]
MCGLLNRECKWSSSGPLNFNPSSSMAFSIGSVLNIGVFAATARRHEYGRAGEIPTGRIWLLSRLRVASTMPQENHMRINASTSHGKSFASFHCRGGADAKASSSFIRGLAIRRKVLKYAGVGR